MRMIQDRLDDQWGARIRELRKEHGWSLLQLAIRTETDPGHLSRIERGLVRPDDERRMRIAAALGVQVIDIWEYPEVKAS